MNTQAFLIALSKCVSNSFCVGYQCNILQTLNPCISIYVEIKRPDNKYEIAFILSSACELQSNWHCLQDQNVASLPALNFLSEFVTFVPAVRASFPLRSWMGETNDGVTSATLRPPRNKNTPSDED
jgi:hypothetical protein